MNFPINYRPFLSANWKNQMSAKAVNKMKQRDPVDWSWCSQLFISSARARNHVSEVFGTNTENKSSEDFGQNHRGEEHEHGWRGQTCTQEKKVWQWELINKTAKSRRKVREQRWDGKNGKLKRRATGHVLGDWNKLGKREDRTRREDSEENARGKDGNQGAIQRQERSMSNSLEVKC